tara:strand:+ start:84 stop:482 length:399 start_codon:yes stop_codon:yes gene_type:complete
MKTIDISNILYILLSVLFFTIGIASGQDFVSSDNFNNKIAKDVVVVEFWVEWNSSNQFAELNKLKECEKYRVDIGKCSKIQNEYGVSAIPTVIVFDNGEEKERFEPNIMFQLEADKKVIQHSVDTITLNKFQ